MRNIGWEDFQGLCMVQLKLLKLLKGLDNLAFEMIQIFLTMGC
jgi:hypothetical protein